MLVEFLIILGLLTMNGVFALAEIAVVSSRKTRLKAMAEEGSVNAQAALDLTTDPTRFLSTVQIGITLVGIFAGAFGGATIAERLGAWVAGFPTLAPYSELIGIVIVVTVLTFLSLVIGELVPKRIALANPERHALLVARPMAFLSRIASPAVWLLSLSTNLVVRSFGLAKEQEPPPSDEEVAQLIEQGTSAGVFHRAERAMVEGVLQLDERRVTDLMTRRTKIVWLNIADSDEVNWRKIVTSGHSHFPVYEGTRDTVIGLVSVKALWANAAFGLPNNLRDHLTKPLIVPESITAIQLLDNFKKTGKHLALVCDEFGSVQGLVTLIDVMEAIVGDLPEPGDRRDPEAHKRDDGSWLVDASMPCEAARDLLFLPDLPGESENFETIGGFVLGRLGHLPSPGEFFEWQGWRFEIVDMDRQRIDKILIRPPPPPPPPTDDASS